MRAEENRLVNALFAIRRELADFEQEIAAKRPLSTSLPFVRRPYDPLPTLRPGTDLGDNLPARRKEAIRHHGR